MNTGCEFHEDALADFVAGRLEAGRTQRLEAHLATCEACRSTLAVFEAVRAMSVPVPAGLERQVRDAARAALAAPAHETTAEEYADAARRRPSLASRWRVVRPAWALPVAAAAAVAVFWVAPGLDRGDGGGEAAEEARVAWQAAEPYGALPAEDGMVAGEPLLSDLSVEELERLLEELDR